MKRSCLLLVSGAISVLGIAPSAFAEPVTRNTEFSVTVNPYLNVTLSSNDVHLPITPSSGGTYGSTYFTATSSTNNALGYSLNLAIKDTNTAQAVLTTNLTSDTINVNDGTKPVIPTFSTNDVLTNAEFSASTSADHLNHWAMSLNDTDHYQKVLSESTIATSDGPIADDVTTLNLATKLDLLTPPGSYSAYFNFEIVANVARDSIDDDGKYPANSLLRAYEIAYTRAGKPMYVETEDLTNYPIGWRPMTDEDEPTIGGKEVRFAIQDITMTFEENDQTKNVCEWARSSSADNSYMDTALVMDLRDGTSYNIIKGADGRCWLADNLALDPLASNTTLSASNTNAPAEAITNYLSSSGIALHNGWATSAVAYSSGSTNYYDQPRIFTYMKNAVAGSNQDPLNTEVVNGSWKVGIFYNVCAASIGTYCYAQNQGADTAGTDIDIEYDICPAGWRLPTSGNNGEYYSFADATVAKIVNDDVIDSTDPGYSVIRTALRLPLSGYFKNGSPIGLGQPGYLWSSTIYDGSSIYHASTTNTNIRTSNVNYRSDGGSVRCIAK